MLYVGPGQHEQRRQHRGGENIIILLVLPNLNIFAIFLIIYLYLSFVIYTKKLLKIIKKTLFCLQLMANTTLQVAAGLVIFVQAVLSLPHQP